jgi:DNA damage-binding protein 1
LVEQNEDDSFIEIMEYFPNLGPIVDMCVVDIEKQGQGQLITCSGAYKEGSLRVIRNGIGIQEHASIELPGIKGIWPVRLNSERFDNVLVVSFVGESRFLTISPDDVSGVEIQGFTDSEQTFTSGNVIHNQIIQVTASGVRLASAVDGRLLDQWSPPGNLNNKISVVANNESQVVCAVRETIYYLEIAESKIIQVTGQKMDFEVACLDVTPLVNPLDAESLHRASICAVGFWTEISLSLLKLPDLSLLTNQKLDGEQFIPRSIMLATFDNGTSHYLLSALGDGSLFYFSLDPSDGSLKEKKKVTLGTQPTVLRAFKSSSSGNHEVMNNSMNSNIFACSDRPTVVYSSSHKLLFSNVNLKQVNHMSSLNAEAYPDSLALANDSCLLIGRIDEIQKLHIRTIPLGETPRRIAYQESSKTFGLITQRFDLGSNESGSDLPQNQGRNSASFCAISSSRAESSFSRTTNSINDNNMEIETYNLLILDQHTFEVLHAHTFMPGEVALSILSSSLGSTTSHETFYVVGTCSVNPEEPEPKVGRLIVFQWKGDQQKLHTIAEKEIKGAPYQLAGLFLMSWACLLWTCTNISHCFSTEFHAGRLLAAVNSTVRLFEFTRERELHNECNYYNTIMALYLKTKGDFVLVGDLMRSISLLNYKPIEGTLEEISKDFNPNWVTAIEILDDDHFLGAENSFNLFVCAKDR